jgi:TRAP-type C4-dicarboxylate transport system substrate-binding protein
MVTLAQLKSERKKAFRAVLRDLNKVQLKFNKLDRELHRRLQKHNVQLLDIEDAEKIVAFSQDLYDEINNYASAIMGDLSMFFI